MNEDAFGRPKLVVAGQLAAGDQAQIGYTSPHSEDALQDASRQSGVFRVYVQVEGEEVFIGNSDEVGPSALMVVTRQAQDYAWRLSRALDYVLGREMPNLDSHQCAVLEAILRGERREQSGT